MKRFFELLTICCFVISLGCQKEIPPVEQVPDNVDTTTNLPQTPDSVLILTKVTSSYGMNLSLAYDLEHKRYSSWSETYPVYYDSTLIFYNAQGKVSRLVRKNGDIGDAFEVYPSFFEKNHFVWFPGHIRIAIWFRCPYKLKDRQNVIPAE